MKELIFTILLILTIVMPLMVYFKGKQTRNSFKKSLAFNAISFFSIMMIATFVTFSSTVNAQGPEAINGLGLIGAAIPTAGSSIGAGIATGQAASAALGAISEDPKMFGKALIFVAMAEGIALYGLLISFFIISKLG